VDLIRQTRGEVDESKEIEFIANTADWESAFLWFSDLIHSSAIQNSVTFSGKRASEWGKLSENVIFNWGT